jgi:prolyl oligopeptidase
MRAAFVCLLLMSVGAASANAQQPVSSNDPYIWLEDVSGQRSMDWVNSHNAKTQAVLEADPRYQQYYDEALAIAQATDRIPYGSFRGNQIYNFWQDADHVRGILRRTTRASYESGQPKWTTVLDLDALAKAEKANWVFKGMSCARPAERRCLISLSDGGEDKVTIREFDLPTAKFVKGGFVLQMGMQDDSCLV